MLCLPEHPLRHLFRTLRKCNGVVANKLTEFSGNLHRSHLLSFVPAMTLDIIFILNYISVAPL